MGMPDLLKLYLILFSKVLSFKKCNDYTKNVSIEMHFYKYMSIEI